jgi:hypothetical protein
MSEIVRTLSAVEVSVIRAALQGITLLLQKLRLFFIVFFWFVACFAMTGCAVTPKTVPHSFAFTADMDSPSIEVLDYRYGSEKLARVRAPEWRVQQGEPTHGNGYFGDMPIGEELYVKWRIKSTKEVLEKTIDLRPLLPVDMQGVTIDFTIDQKDISIFVVYRKYKDKNAPSIGPRRYYADQVMQIYPVRISNFK